MGTLKKSEMAKQWPVSAVNTSTYPFHPIFETTCNTLEQRRHLEP
jgi:hypothetical protein